MSTSGSKRTAEGATLRFLTKRRLVVLAAFILLAVVADVAGVFLYITSSAFKERARVYVIRQIEQNTGAAVTLNHLSINLRQQHFRLDGLVLRGLEPPG